MQSDKTCVGNQVVALKKYEFFKVDYTQPVFNMKTGKRDRIMLLTFSLIAGIQLNSIKIRVKRSAILICVIYDTSNDMRNVNYFSTKQ